MAGKEHRDMWRVLTNDDGDRSAMVPDDSPESIRRACKEIATEKFGRSDDEELVDWLVAHARSVTWRQHTRREPDDGYPCGCEEEGWWCEEGTSRPRRFVYVEGGDLHMAWENLG